MFGRHTSLAGNYDNPETIVARVHGHMIIKDYHSACSDARVGTTLFPQSQAVWKVYIKALAKAGEEKKMVSCWQEFKRNFPEEETDRDLLESLAWGVIDRGASSSSPTIRLFSMLGAFFSQDSKGIVILRKCLCDSNSFLRSAALQLSSHLGDASLRDEAVRLFKHDSNWNVRLSAIKALGAMKIREARPALIEILAAKGSTAEEKSTAIQALVEMSNEIDRNELIKLLQSKHSGLRLLACELIAADAKEEDASLLFPLLRDHHADVRAATLQALGIIRVQAFASDAIVKLIQPHAEDPNPNVSTAAAWLLMLHDPVKGKQAFTPLLFHESQDVRLMAAGALTATGKNGVSLVLEVFEKSQDDFVKMNLALALISQRTEIPLACTTLYQGLSQQSHGRWMWKKQGIFRALAPSDVGFDESIPNHPETVNQLTRLEILNILAFMHDPHAQQAIKAFLSERKWGVSGMAAVLLLTEGDDSAVDIVQDLLNDPDAQVRIQAAIILALWGQGESAVHVLHDMYPKADRELKEKILESIGKVGSPSSLPFLVSLLNEPYQTLRIIAAAALLECLYH